MQYRKVCQTPTGPQVFVFDHLPPEPTIDQLRACLPHTCFTCRWRWLRGTSHCRAPELPEGQYCPCWDIRYDAMDAGELEYYSRLHAQSVAGCAV